MNITLTKEQTEYILAGLSKIADDCNNGKDENGFDAEKVNELYFKLQFLHNESCENYM